MSKSHKDLPGGSQDWAAEVDALMAEVKTLKDVVRRLSQNAGIDYANPNRGVNAGNTPSVKSPVGQKLSSLADVDTYNVLDGQALTWNRKGQKWLPVTPATGGAAVPITVAYTNGGTMTGYGSFDIPNKVWAYTGTNPTGNVEIWGTAKAYAGAGDWNTGTGYSLIELSGGDAFGRPYVQLNAYDYTDNTSASMVVNSYQVRIETAYFVAHRCTTAGRPAALGTSTQRRGAMVYDTTLNIPIWWNGTTWTNALGTAV